MRLSRRLGFHTLFPNISRAADYNFNLLWVVLVWCMSGAGLVEGRPTPRRDCLEYDYCNITHQQPHYYVSVRDSPSGSPPSFISPPPPGPPPPGPPPPGPPPPGPPPPGPPPPGPPPPGPPPPGPCPPGPPPPSSSPPPTPPSAHNSLTDPVNIALATIGGIAGILLLGSLFYKLYSKWSTLENDGGPLWPPPDAPRNEIVQVVELIRMGMIDAHCAPAHVLNWVLHGVDAPWPPPGGIEAFERRLRRGRRGRRLTASIIPRSNRPARSNVPRDGNIELPRRTRHHRHGISRPLSVTTVEPLPLYVRDADQDDNHYSVTVLPPDFPPLPPDPFPSAPEFLASSEVPRTFSTATTPRSSVNGDEDSSAGSQRTGSLGEHDDTPLTALTPRPPPPACFLVSPQIHNSVTLSASTTTNQG